MYSLRIRISFIISNADGKREKKENMEISLKSEHKKENRELEWIITEMLRSAYVEEGWTSAEGIPPAVDIKSYRIENRIKV